MHWGKIPKLTKIPNDVVHKMLLLVPKLKKKKTIKVKYLWEERSEREKRGMFMQGT
jgi:hypothetical protein